MEIISGQNVDLIAPFPQAQTRRIFGWSRCYRTFIDNDALPAKIDPYTEYMTQFLSLPIVFSWGVVDKNRITNDRHEAPLVGLVAFEGAAYGGFLHFAAARKAFKMGLLDEAIPLVLKHIFSTSPTTLRVGAHVDERNYPAKALFRALGFRFEGVSESAFLQHSEARNSVMFGLSRARYETAYGTQPSDEPEDTAEIVSSGVDLTDALNAAGWGSVDAVEGYETGGLPLIGDLYGDSTDTSVPSE